MPAVDVRRQLQRVKGQASVAAAQDGAQPSDAGPPPLRGDGTARRPSPPAGRARRPPAAVGAGFRLSATAHRSRTRTRRQPSRTYCEKLAGLVCASMTSGIARCRCSWLKACPREWSWRRSATARSRPRWTYTATSCRRCYRSRRTRWTVRSEAEARTTGSPVRWRGRLSLHKAPNSVDDRVEGRDSFAVQVPRRLKPLP
jgi:hypothetical protein